MRANSDLILGLREETCELGLGFTTTWKVLAKWCAGASIGVPLSKGACHDRAREAQPAAVIASERGGSGARTAPGADGGGGGERSGGGGG
eukprot:6214539-Pleurochrysis_carterae.AAC.3